MEHIQRSEYPRPQFRREKWQTLNGEWEFCFDDDNVGAKKGYPSGRRALEKRIVVPFSYQYPASGSGDTAYHPVVWYRRTFSAQPMKKGERALLCFNGCDYVADVWVNGFHAVTHTGAYAPFFADVTDYLSRNGKNVVVVRCYDPLDPTIPRGKQSWTGGRFGCWYIPNTGIWQSVWLEYCGEDCIRSYSLIPDIDTCSFSGEIEALYALADEAELIVSRKGKEIKRQRFSTDGKYTRYTVRLMEEDFVDESHFWTPEHPELYDVDFVLYRKGKQVDLAHTRFGMRKISVDETGKICLNNRPYYQRLILDQGYWEESGITPPSASALREDILLAKAMGFNGARKHQKLEDPYFYYYAEELGFLTWCEMPSAYNFNADEIAALTAQWQEIVRVARNFTSVVCYVPLNESWGVRKLLLDAEQQDFARSMYYLTSALDESRLVSTNDGWENPEATDIISVHDYAYDSSEFGKKYIDGDLDALYPGYRKLTACGCNYAGQPVILTEFGGIAMSDAAKNGGWGYNSGAESEEEFYERYKNLIDGIYECNFCGFCYTQLTDVQQEVNGLLRADHTCKFDADRVRAITEGKNR